MPASPRVPKTHSPQLDQARNFQDLSIIDPALPASYDKTHQGGTNTTPLPANHPTAHSTTSTNINAPADSKTLRPQPARMTTSERQLQPIMQTLTPTKSEDVRRTPKERLNAYLASDTTRPSLAISSENLPRPFVGRTVSSSSIPSTPSKPTPTSANSAVKILRDPSLDSFVSSNSSNVSPPMSGSARFANSPGASDEASALRDTDPDIIIKNSASSEIAVENLKAAVEKLRKEKQARTEKDQRMWKLLEKQRSMILGLNQELGKAVKARDKYKKKLKEHLVLPASDDIEDEPDRNEEPSATSRTATRQEIVSDVSKGSAAAASPATSSKPTAIAIQLLDPANGPEAREVEAGPAVTPDQRKPQPVPAPLALRRGNVGSGLKSPDPARSPMDTVISPVMSSPFTPGGEGRKKAPPTPLKLGQLHSPSAAPPPSRDLPHPPNEHTGTERLLQEGSDDGRGRKKTREDDDRIREASYIEDERRSRSTKKSKSKTKAPSQEQDVNRSVTGDPPTGLVDGVGLPSSPRAPLLGGLQSPPFQPPLGSIAGMMNRTGPFTLSGPPNQPPPTPSLNALKSPGLPMSPRPGDRPLIGAEPRSKVQHTMMAPPMSPGPMSARGGILSPRPPRQPIPMPSSLSKEVIAQSQPAGGRMGNEKAIAERMQARRLNQQSSKHTSTSSLGTIYRGFTEEQYPDLLLPPAALSQVFACVDSGRLRPSRHIADASKLPEDDDVFTLSVVSRADNKQLWRIEKTARKLFQFDHTLRGSSMFDAPLPGHSLFAGDAPLDIDERRAALNGYIGAVLAYQYTEAAAMEICTFLSTDAIEPALASGSMLSRSSFERPMRKEGYLSVKGRQKSGWQSRYFILDGKDLQYYEVPRGKHVGSIRLHKAQIGPQIADASTADTEYSHAFVILEQKSDDSATLIRNILCAETDAERDDWINALRTYVEGLSGPPSPAVSLSNSPKQGDSPRKLTKERPILASVQQRSLQFQSVGYDQMTAAAAPIMGSPSDTNGTNSPTDRSDSPSSSVFGGNDRPSISGPVAGGPIQNSSAWGNKSPTQKRNIFGFKFRGPEDSSGATLRSPNPNQESFRQPSGRPVFGLGLTEAADQYPPRGVDICLPSPVYRCIEYLEARQASRQEGLFRVPGSQTVIQALKQRFNQEGDVDLVAERPEVEIMAVADLLRLYCRELPEPVLTRELVLDFHKVLEFSKHTDRVMAYNVLVHRLPEANFELLATIIRYLLRVAADSAENKMHERNLATIWSSTIQAPFPLMILLITEYEAIFGDAVDEQASSPIIQSLGSASTEATENIEPTMSDLRSPRKQMFMDLATPGPTQLHFTQDNGIQSRSQQQYGPLRPPAHIQPQTQPIYRPVRHIAPPSGEQSFSSLNAALAPSPSIGPMEFLSTTSPPSASKEQKKARRQSGLKNLISAPMSPGLSPQSQTQTQTQTQAKRKSSMGRLRDMAGIREG